MELCLMIEGQEGVTWPQWLDLAGACEQHGIGTLFRSDHYMNLDVDDAAEQLQTLAEAGVDRVMCQQLLHDDLDAVALLGERLAPAVA